MTLEEWIASLTDGRYRMRVKTLAPGERPMTFPPGFSVVSGDKQLVVVPEEADNRTAMGMSEPH